MRRWSRFESPRSLAASTNDFEKFEVFEGAVLDALEDRFDLGVARFGQNLGKLHRLLDKKQGVGLVGGFARFASGDIQLHVHNVAKNGGRDFDAKKFSA